MINHSLAEAGSQIFWLACRGSRELWRHQVNLATKTTTTTSPPPVGRRHSALSAWRSHRRVHRTSSLRISLSGTPTQRWAWSVGIIAVGGRSRQRWRPGHVRRRSASESVRIASARWESASRESRSRGPSPRCGLRHLVTPWRRVIQIVLPFGVGEALCGRAGAAGPAVIESFCERFDWAMSPAGSETT